MTKLRSSPRSLAPGLSRRAFNRSLASLGLGLVSLPMLRRTAHAGKPPLVFEWSGYEVPELYGSYMKTYGKAPEFAFFADINEAFQKVRNGYAADLSHPCSDDMPKWDDAGLVLPIDTGRLSNWKDVIPTLQTFKGVVLGGEVRMVPLDWGNSSVVYRTDLASEYVGEESWKILFDERYKGRLAMYDTSTAVIVAGLVLGYGNGVWSMSDAQIAECRKLLEKQAKLMRFYWSDQSEIEQALASGEVVAAYAWNDAYVRLKDQGIPVKYMHPKEGILTWLCGLARLKNGTGDEQMVYDYLDAWLAPETGKYVIEEFGYGHANRKAFALASPEKVAALGFSADPAEMLAEGHIFSYIPPKINQKYIDMFEEVKAASGV